MLIEAARSELNADGDNEGRNLLLGFKGFGAFYDWWDTCTAYDQMDHEEYAEDISPFIEVVYLALRTEYLGLPGMEQVRWAVSA
jgi:hypothetical protein